MTKLIIFDMDGLMFDTEPLYYKANQQTADKIGIPFDYSFYEKYIGASEKDFFSAMYDHFDESKVDQFITDSVEDLKSVLFSAPPVLKKGLVDLLDFLKENKYKTVVASSSEKKVVLELLENAGLTHYFDGVIGGDEVSHSKPHPEIFEKARQLIDGPISDILVLEDSINGIKAANAANFPVVMVPDLIKPDSHMKKMTLDICHDLHEVLNKIKSEKLI
ncbi:HAD family hydrolase [Alkalibacterium olivapovliticus]|uniref:HAD superfamily hydrolase (TIGR01509 family) n=1 Tax=Alkalibacterium olivapovliticus TaxID=99907 RepID=A0A2T0WBC0_9LACT|nr:HAD family phosphatase [Alkalibacterium olivapovliticus]PRY83926.1 HAD superfamily hydrolase (TIGR01509 family) [Alkalibacterium olivapovliticus]